MTVCSLQRLLLLLQDKDKEVEELLQEIQCEKVPSPMAAPPRPAEHSGWKALGLETGVQVLALELSPSPQRLKPRQHRSSPSPWSPCAGTCRHSFGAKRQRTVACACRSRCLRAHAREAGEAGEGGGRGLAEAATRREALPQSIVGQLLPNHWCFPGSGTVARAVGLEVWGSLRSDWVDVVPRASHFIPQAVSSPDSPWGGGTVSY